MKYSTLKCVLIEFMVLMVLTGYGMADPQNNEEPAMHTEHWRESDEFGVPMWIALNMSDEKSRRRRIFVYLQSPDFSKDNVQSTATGLATQYPEPKSLILTIFSDRVMLHRAMNVYQSAWVIEFSNAPEKQEAVRRFKERFWPLKSGYYRAHYTRSANGDESLLYSVDPDKHEMTPMGLKAQK